MAFDSRQYEWADLTVIVGGRDIIGIRSIKINRKAEREPLYAKGRNPHSIQTGNFSYSGEIGVLQSELIALEEAGDGDIFSLSVDILAGFGNPSNGDDMRYKRASGARFVDTNEELKQGDKFMEIAIPFECLNWKPVK